MKNSDSKPTSKRLNGLDLARFLAFVGMVIVNFKIVMGAEQSGGIAGIVGSALEGRAAATFVVLAGVGLGLSVLRGNQQTFYVTVKRALFLMILGLLNMVIFEADILHYYAIYFLLGVLLVPLGTGKLIAVIAGLNLTFVVMILALNYNVGWDWATYSYSGFWTAQGFVRNLFFNGWHPIFPWLGFLLFGIIISRLRLNEKRTQYRLIGFGALFLVLTEVLSLVLKTVSSGVDPELPVLLTTKPIPPMPLYTVAGFAASSMVIGFCLRISDVFKKSALLAIGVLAGRQTLTLYIAHIIIGMGMLDVLGLLGDQTAGAALAASLLFCLIATIYVLLWARVFKRGPIEAVMHRLTG